MTPTTSLPHRFREKSFRSYEELISVIVNRFPEAVVIDPSTLGKAPITVAARLRDAITSLSKYLWSTKVNMDNFLRIDRLIVVSERSDGMVLAGSREAIKTIQASPILKPMTEVHPSVQPELTIDGDDSAAIQSALVLLEKQLIQGPIVVRNPQPSIKDFEQTFEVAIEVNGNEAVII